MLVVHANVERYLWNGSRKAEIRDERCDDQSAAEKVHCHPRAERDEGSWYKESLNEKQNNKLSR